MEKAKKDLKVDEETEIGDTHGVCSYGVCFRE